MLLISFRVYTCMSQRNTHALLTSPAGVGIAKLLFIKSSDAQQSFVYHKTNSYYY